MRDVFCRDLAEVFEAKGELVAYRVSNSAGDIDAAGLRHCLQSSRNIHAVAVDVVSKADDVTDVNADAELDPLLRGHPLVALVYAALHIDGAAHGVDRTRELHQQAVARGLDDATAVAGDGRVYQFSPVSIQCTKRPDLVGTHELAIADNRPLYSPGSQRCSECIQMATEQAYAIHILPVRCVGNG
jgi:hypothetical protein